MGKCILAGHPPVGGQIGYGTYTGNGGATRTISLGVTPKWVLVLWKGIYTTTAPAGEDYGGLAIAGYPTTRVAVSSNGFAVQDAANCSGGVFHYIYGT